MKSNGFPPTRIIVRVFAILGLFLFSSAPCSLAQNKAIAPADAKGRSLNLDFEDGTLRDWTASGNAFAKQPVRGDTVAKRRAGETSGHQGQFWIGGYEIAGDDAIGTLTSAPFKVTQRWASFLVAGGDWEATRVELVDAKSDKAFFKISGENNEHLRHVVVDMEKQLGSEIFIRLVDEQKGGWGHINFDDFKLYADRPKFADEIDPAKRSSVPEADKVMFQGLSPEEAVAKMTLPPGFKATLFAGEPDVKQPIAFAIDDRGRLWVAEAFTYPKRAPEGEGKDRILVFEDTDGDGKFNKSTVFAENLNLVSGIEVGFGGVFVGAAPYLMFFPVNDWDNPKANGKPEILLDGWDYARDTHETLNSFKWGPDGWLYGCHGVFCPSNVGKPGAPDSERQWMDAGIWRYHPTKKIFEVFAEGTSNPWGFDFDEHGQLFEEACVIPHLFHMIQGGRYQRQGGSHFAINADERARFSKTHEGAKIVHPYIYDDIKTVADHVHYAGDKGPHAGNGRSASAGGGHAHAGLMIYQGDNWPEEYRGKIFMNNIHGACINQDVPVRQGSGFVAHHAPNLINFNDSWSQIINIQSGPDGAVYMIDWYDKNQCHHNDVNGHDRTNGRIFKISHGDTKFEKIDLQKLSDEELVKLLASKNNWQARHAQRILQERFEGLITDSNDIAGTEEMVRRFREGEAAAKFSKTRNELRDQLETESTVEKLRLLWSLHAAGRIEIESALRYFRDAHEFVRAWMIQLTCEDPSFWYDLAEKGGGTRYSLKDSKATVLFEEFVRLAREDKSPVVRLYLASALQRLPLENRWEILEALYSHSEDAGDHNIPLMLWFAAEPLAAENPARALKMAEATKLPNLLNFTVRRVTALGTPDAMAQAVESLKRAAELHSAENVATKSASQKNRASAENISAARCLDILNGLSIALKGQRSAAMPRGWSDIEKSLGESSNAEIRSQVQSLSLTFGSSSALAALKKTLMDSAADIAARRTALNSLLSAKDPTLAPLLQKLLGDAELQGAALRGLATYDAPQTAEKILALYNSFSNPEKRDALNTLASRAAFAKPLLAAIASGKISSKDLSADLVRQLRSFKNKELNQQLEKVWGAIHESSGDKLAQIDKYRKIYRAGGSQPGDASRGRVVFSKTCQQCHTLFDVGGKVGPDLTGSARGDLDYILQNMVDPNAVIPNEYRSSTLETKDDRVLTGIVKAQDENSVTIATANETVTIPRNEIASLRQSELSMMPEGLLEPLSEQEVRDLIYYLSRPGQVPMAAGQ